MNTVIKRVRQKKNPEKFNCDPYGIFKNVEKYYKDLESGEIQKKLYQTFCIGKWIRK